jgi:hypothetical protein
MVKEYMKKAINWAQEKGIYNIKANCQGFEQPSQFTKFAEEQPYIPDVTGKKSGNKFYVEIVTKKENKQRSVSKWKLLSTLAKTQGGKLFLLAPKGHKAFAEGILKEHNLNDAQVIYMPNI